MQPFHDDLRPPPQVSQQSMSLLALFLLFLRFGSLAFGGPVAQIAMIRAELVEQRRWITTDRFNRLLAVLQALPGPEAHELCVHLGIVARGRVGGFLAGAGFMLPGFALMLLIGWAYRDWLQANAQFAPALLGIQIAMLVIIARAVARIGWHILTASLFWLLAGIAFAATLFAVPFWIPLVAAALISATAQRPAIAVSIACIAAGVAWAYVDVPAETIPTLAVPTVNVDTLALFFAGLKGGLLTFGGAYTAIPYVRADTVQRGWLSDAAFLDGVAFANIIPAPLVIFATFTGFVVGGLPGALAITAGMFLPAFAFSMIFFEQLENIIDHPKLKTALNGIAAAVVGVIAATLIMLGTATVARVTDLGAAFAIVIATIAVIGLSRSKWATAIVVAGAGAAGWILTP